MMGKTNTKRRSKVTTSGVFLDLLSCLVIIGAETSRSATPLSERISITGGTPDLTTMNTPKTSTQQPSQWQVATMVTIGFAIV